LGSPDLGYVKGYPLKRIVSLVFSLVFATVGFGNHVSGRSWLEPAPNPLKRNAMSPGQSEVALDIAALFDHAHGETRVVTLTPERSLAITGLRRLDGADGARTWVGMHREGVAEQPVFVTVKDGYVYGTVYASDTVFEIVGDASSGAVHLLDQKAAGHTMAPPSANDFIVPPRPLLVSPSNVDDPLKSSDIVSFATPAPQSVIDLLVVYTDGMVARFGSVSGVLARINNLVAQSNTAYLNSEVGITLRLVATLQTSYSETTSNQLALNDIIPSIPAFGRVVVTPPTLQGVASLRDSSLADLVMLIRPFRRNAHAACGMAARNGTVGFDMAAYEGWAYGVFSEGLDLEAGNGTCPDTAFSHEMGHIMGMDHDRPNAASTPPVSYGFGFGYGYNAAGCPAGYCGQPTHGDIMSIAYVNRLLPCYSHPGIRISSDGLSCGLNVGSGTVAGVAPDTPEESCIGSAAGCGAAAASCTTNSTCAHSARALNYVRVRVSRWRDAAVTGSISQGVNAVPGATLCTSDPNILCTVTSNTYRCSGPAGWTGSIHPRAAGYRIPAVVVPAALGSTMTSNISAQLDSEYPGCNLDVDGNGMLEAATDGTAVMRRMLGFGAGSYGSLAGTCAQITSDAALMTSSSKAAVAASGAPITLASTDGLILLRAMRGLTGAAVTQDAIGAGATRTQWNAPAGPNANIREWLNANCGTAFVP
jgi:Metallo-peptidase family M12B Reprolysin-like